MNGKERLWNALLRIADETGASIRPNDQGPYKPPIIIPHKDASITIRMRSIPVGDYLQIFFDGFISRAGSGSMESRSLLSIAEGCYRDATLAAELDRERIHVTPEDLKEISALLEDHPVNDNDKPYWYHSSSPYMSTMPVSRDNLTNLIGRIELIQTLTGADVEVKEGHIHFRYPENIRIRLGLSLVLNEDNTILVQCAGSSDSFMNSLNAGVLGQISEEADTASKLLNLFEKQPLKVTSEEFGRMVEHYATISAQEEQPETGYKDVTQEM